MMLVDLHLIASLIFFSVFSLQCDVLLPFITPVVVVACVCPGLHTSRSAAALATHRSRHGSAALATQRSQGTPSHTPIGAAGKRPPSATVTPHTGRTQASGHHHFFGGKHQATETDAVAGASAADRAFGVPFSPPPASMGAPRRLSLTGMELDNTGGITTGARVREAFEFAK